MQYHWLNRQNNDKLIAFFAGWSFDSNPFQFLKCEDYDVVVFYDYSTLETDFDFSIFDEYKEKNLITWSMGVFCAYVLSDKFKYFDKKFAINGTVYPVDDKYGIPLKPFELTLKHSKKGLEGKFYRNIFLKDCEYERYLQNPVERNIDNRVEELEKLYLRISKYDIIYKNFYDCALVSKFDKIIPSNNQINFWSKYNTEYRLIESGHFPFYNYKAWKDLL